MATLLSVISPLLSIHENVCQQQSKFDNEVRRLAKLDETMRRLMTELLADFASYLAYLCPLKS